MAVLFSEVLLPDRISYGVSGGPKFNNDVVFTKSGHRTVNINWSTALMEWNLLYDVENQANIEALIAFFRARSGNAYGFRFKDHTDFTATTQHVGWAGGGTGQLRKIYTSGSITGSADIDFTATQLTSTTTDKFRDVVLDTKILISGATLGNNNGLFTVTARNDTIAVVSANATPNTFVVATDLTTTFPIGRKFTINGSTGASNDLEYTVIAVSFSSPDTTISVTNVPIDDTNVAQVIITALDVTADPTDGATVVDTSESPTISLNAEARDIFKPIRGIFSPVTTTIALFKNGVSWSSDTNDWTADETTGIVTYNGVADPGASDSVTASFEFHVPVHFVEDFLDIEIQAFQVHGIRNLTVRELNLAT